MKIEVTPNPTPNYPRLMQGEISSSIYLMIDDSTGIVIQKGSNTSSGHPVGKIITDLSPRNVRPWHGTITLTS